MQQLGCVCKYLEKLCFSVCNFSIGECLFFKLNFGFCVLLRVESCCARCWRSCVWLGISFCGFVRSCEGDMAQQATFAAGCFWSVELAFQRVPGVTKVG